MRAQWTGRLTHRALRYHAYHLRRALDMFQTKLPRALWLKHPGPLVTCDQAASSHSNQATRWASTDAGNHKNTYI